LHPACILGASARAALVSPRLDISLPRLGLEVSASASPCLAPSYGCLGSASASAYLPQPLPLPHEKCLDYITGKIIGNFLEVV